MSPLSGAIASKFLGMKLAVTIGGYTYLSAHKGVGTSNVCVAHTLRLHWGVLVCVDMASEHKIKRSSMDHMDDVIDISSVYL
jgi:hypothetical protein